MKEMIQWGNSALLRSYTIIADHVKDYVLRVVPTLFGN